MNHTSSLVRGTGNRDYTLARLDRPELAERVRSKELSANKAAIEAGFRKKATPFEIVCRQIPKLTPEQRRQLRELLS